MNNENYFVLSMDIVKDAGETTLDNNFHIRFANFLDEKWNKR